MASYNKVIMLGNLTRDPQLTYLPSQTPVAEFGLATNRRFKGSDGQWRDETCFVDCRMYGNRAEVINKYLKKGDPLMIEGRLQFDRWEAQDGSKRSKHRIFVENFEFVNQQRGGAGGNTGSGGGGGYDAGADYSHAPYDGGEEPPIPPADDDIPF